MPKLYEITESLKGLEQLVDNIDLTEEEENEVLALWSRAEFSLEEKTQGIVSLVKMIDGDSSAISEEIKRLQRMKKIIKNRKERLKQMMLEAMQVLGKTEIATALYKVKVKNNPESIELDEDFPASKLPPEFQSVKIEANKTAIKDFYRTTKTLPLGVKIKRRKSLTIS